MASSGDDVTQWVQRNKLGDNVAHVLINENGMQTMEDIKNLQLYGIAEVMGLNLAEKNRLKTALSKLGTEVPEDTTPTPSRVDVPAVQDVTHENKTESVVPQTPVKVHDIQHMKDSAESVTEEGGLTHYKLAVSEVGRSSSHLVRRCQHGNEPEIPKQRSILVIGETGSGKSTMIDTIINYICNITKDDKHRFHIIDNLEEDIKGKGKADSVTDWITCYTVHPPVESLLNFTINIVDTPGFGDTRGVTRDQDIIEQIKELFKTREKYGLDSIHAVCFVIKSSLNRLTVSQKYILEAVMKLFGNDLRENIFIMCSHCDNDNSTMVEEALKHYQVPYEAAYVFNNKWMKNTDKLSEIFFTMSKKNMNIFFDRVKNIAPKSLLLSAQVLEERKELEDCADALQRLISSTTGKIDEIIQTKRAVKSQDSSGKGIQISIMDKRKTDVKNFNCNQCEVTCRLYVGIFEKKLMSQETCSICECSTADHVVDMYLYEWKQKLTMTASPDANLNSRQRKLVKDFQFQLKKMQEKMCRLKEIALKPESRATEDYIDFAIDHEAKTAQPGWQERLEVLHKLKAHYGVISNLKDGDNQLFELLN